MFYGELQSGNAAILVALLMLKNVTCQKLLVTHMEITLHVSLRKPTHSPFPRASCTRIAVDCWLALFT